jgi:hypothetical protein
MRSLVAVAKFLVRLLLQAMNDFPLFAILLRVKDPRRLPGNLLKNFTDATARSLGFTGSVYFYPVVDLPQTLFLEVCLLFGSS